MTVEKADHQAKPSRNSWDQPSASEVKPQHTLFEVTKRQGQPSSLTRSPSASRNNTVSPGGQESPSSKIIVKLETEWPETGVRWTG